MVPNVVPSISMVLILVLVPGRGSDPTQPTSSLSAGADWTPTVPIGHQNPDRPCRFVLKPTIPMHQASRVEEAPPAAVGDRVRHQPLHLGIPVRTLPRGHARRRRDLTSKACSRH